MTGTGTGTWPGIIDDAEELNWYVGVWNDLGYAEPPTPECHPIPPLGERDARAIKGGHEAVAKIDEIIRTLQVLRGQLITEMRTDADIRAERIDKMLAGRKAGSS